MLCGTYHALDYKPFEEVFAVCFILPEPYSVRKRAATILHFADQGHFIKEIAHALFLSPRTMIHYLRLAVSTMPAVETTTAIALLAGLESEAVK